MAKTKTITFVAWDDEWGCGTTHRKTVRDTNVAQTVKKITKALNAEGFSIRDVKISD